MPLAFNSYENLPNLADGPNLLNLAWTLDERIYLAVDLNRVLADALATEIAEALPAINRYAVKDPYGEEALGPSVAAFFRNSRWSASISAGAGVTTLLHALAALTERRPAYLLGNSYPDFPFWVKHWGSCCLQAEVAPDCTRHPGIAAAAGAALIFLERPSLIGNQAASLVDIATLCEGAAKHKMIVLIDESNANYYPPDFSAINLITDTDNLIVLRGFSKAYGLGGLRLGYCVAAQAIASRVREAIPPLLASSLSLALGKTILDLGDVTKPLRQRIVQNKHIVTQILQDAGLYGLLASSEFLPYLFLQSNDREGRNLLKRRGILGKEHPVWSAQGSNGATFYRLSVPLSSDRLDLLRKRLGNQPASRLT